MRGIDFSSWQGVLSTLAGLVLITLLGVGIRLLVMQTLQQRRERENRQINERLRTLMAAYKTLGGSFTGELGVDPSHRRDLRQREDAEGIAEPRSDRARRIRDAVEAALSDILLLGTDEQVRLAARGQRTGTGAAGAHPRTGGLAARLRARSAGSGADSDRPADTAAGTNPTRCQWWRQGPQRRRCQGRSCGWRWRWRNGGRHGRCGPRRRRRSGRRPCVCQR